ncbi:MAG: hypothetical protein AB7W37_12150 [Syntrophobacteraceae bacterium]
MGVQHWRVGTRSTGGKKAEEEALTGPTAPRVSRGVLATCSDYKIALANPRTPAGYPVGETVEEGGGLGFRHYRRMQVLPEGSPMTEDYQRRTYEENHAILPQDIP